MNSLVAWTKRNSPLILTVTACVTSLASIVMASIATKKLDNKLAKDKDHIVEVHNDMTSGDVDEKAGHKELTKTYAKMGGKIILAYAPSAITFVASCACMFGSYKIQSGRIAALGAAYATLKTSYDAYRDRVKKKIGEESEQEIYQNKDVQEIETVDDKGCKKIKKVLVRKDDPTNMYTLHYDFESSDRCQFNGQEIAEDILAAEKLANDILVRDGYILLKDVYDLLGIRSSWLDSNRIAAGVALGWVYDPEDPNFDSYVSFGIHDKNGKLTPEFEAMYPHRVDGVVGAVNGAEDIWLEFNCINVTGANGGPLFADYSRHKKISKLRFNKGK